MVSNIQAKTNRSLHNAIHLPKPVKTPHNSEYYDESNVSIDSRANDFDSVQSSVFRRPYNDDYANTTSSSVSVQKSTAPKGTRIKTTARKTNVKKVTNTCLEKNDHAFERLWIGSDSKGFNFISTVESKFQKRQKIIEVYNAPPDKTVLPKPCTTGYIQNASSYINRQAKLKEIERMNHLITKKLLNVKSTISTVLITFNYDILSLLF